MSHVLNDLVWEYPGFSKLNHSEKVYLLYLVRCANHKKGLLCYPSIKTGHKITGISEKQIKRNIQRYQELGIMLVDNNGKNNYYHFNQEVLRGEVIVECEKISDNKGAPKVSKDEKLSTDEIIDLDTMSKKVDMVSKPVDTMSKKVDTMTPYNRNESFNYKRKKEEEALSQKNTESELNKNIIDVLALLSDSTGRNYSPKNKYNVERVKYRLKQGYSVEIMKSLVIIKTKEWGHLPHMQPRLTPDVLFGAKHFDKYLTQLKTEEKKMINLEKSQNQSGAPKSPKDIIQEKIKKIIELKAGVEHEIKQLEEMLPGHAIIQSRLQNIVEYDNELMHLRQQLSMLEQNSQNVSFAKII